MATTRAVLRDADDDGASAGPAACARAGRTVATDPAARPATSCSRCGRSCSGSSHQTRARLLGGDTHVPDKVLSVFEPHTETIRKGKISKPNEFGKLVTIQESEHQIITAYEVHAGATGGRDAVDAGAWIGTTRSSAARRISRPAIAASARRPTNRPRSIAASDA